MKSLKSVNDLIECFAKLPGVGLRSAEKMAYSILEIPEEDIETFSSSLLNAKNNVHKCPICGCYTEDEKCEICNDNSRNSQQIIVVSYPKDVASFENLHTYNGTYHVLGGAISAMRGIGAEDLSFDSLLKRIDENNVQEVIIATNPTIEGETTALYLAKLLEKKNITISRLAYGLPMGAHLEYADALTLSRALDGRKKL